jgi:uncharacterized delta-60 repeat protein
VKRLAPLAAVLALLSAAPAAAAPGPPGTPDRGFGRGGTVTLADRSLEFVPELVSFRRGRILVGARAFVPGGGPSPGFSFFRLLPDGRLDRRFGTGGRADAELAGARVGALLPDGAMAAARSTWRRDVRGTLKVVRLTRSGAHDRRFGQNGAATVHVDGVRTVLALAPQPGGAIVVALLLYGGPPPYGFEQAVTLIRLDRRGRLDPSFGVDGRTKVESDLFLNQADVAVRADGGLLVAFPQPGPESGAGLLLAALDADGRRDPTFGADGVVEDPLGPAYPAAIALGRGGRVGVVGTSPFGGGDFAVWQFARDGRRTVFEEVENGAPPENGQAIAFDQAGRMLLAGHTGRFVDRTGFAVARVDGAGRADPGFGRGGHFRRRSRPPAEARAVAVQPDGRVLVAGSQRRGTWVDGIFRRSKPGVIRLLRLWGGPVS